MKRKEPKDYHVLAKERGFEWLGPEVSRNNVKTWWQCSKGHEWETCYSHIQTGTRCPICAIERRAEKRRKKPADYYALAVGRGFKWLGPEVLNNHQRTQWGCASGHKWETAYSNIQQGQGCPYCNGNVRKLPCDYRAIAASRGFKWLGPSTHTVDQKTFWECTFGHKWETRYSVIRNGYGCPICAHKKAAERYRHKPATYYSLADKRGFKWLGPEVGGVHIGTWWECSKEHKWKADYANIQQGKGCPFCAGVAKKTAADYYVLAEMRGFIWQGQEPPKNIHSKTWWGCPERHEWEAPYHDIQQGNGCPHCLDLINGAQVSKAQRRIHKMIGGVLNHPCGRRRIDIALLEKMIAVEYDSWFYHAHKDESKRDAFLLTAGWKILHIKSNEKVPSRQELDEAIARLENGEKIVEIVLSGWGIGPTFAEVRAQKKTDPWEKGPIPISLDSGATFNEVQQLGLW